MTDMLLLVAVMAATGAFAGLVAGLFGIGGGVGNSLGGRGVLNSFSGGGRSSRVGSPATGS